MSEDIRDTEIELLDQLAKDASFKDVPWVSREKAHIFSESDAEAEFIAFSTPVRIGKLIQRLRKAEEENEELRDQLENEEVTSIPTHRTWPDVVHDAIEEFGGFIFFALILFIIYFQDIVKAFHYVPDCKPVVTQTK